MSAQTYDRMSAILGLSMEYTPASVDYNRSRNGTQRVAQVPRPRCRHLGLKKRCATGSYCRAKCAGCAAKVSSRPGRRRGVVGCIDQDFLRYEYQLVSGRRLWFSSAERESFVIVR